jgi:hypothetical protein
MKFKVADIPGFEVDRIAVVGAQERDARVLSRRCDLRVRL